MGVLRSLLEPDTTAVLLGPRAPASRRSSTRSSARSGEDQRGARVRPARAAHHRHPRAARAPVRRVLIDTPGIRVAGLWDGTGESFNDIDSLAAGCRFTDCGHDTEPGCAVREALDPERVAAWRKLQRELAWVTDRRAAQRQRDEWHKQITRQMRKSG